MTNKTPFNHVETQSSFENVDLIPTDVSPATGLSASHPACHVQNGLFIKQNDYYRKYLFSNMKWLEASGSYCYIHLEEDSKIIVAHPLAAVEKRLPKESFIRIHRSYVVNIHAVNAFIGNTICIGKAHLSVSAPYRAFVSSCFDFLETIKTPFKKTTNDAEKEE